MSSGGVAGSSGGASAAGASGSAGASGEAGASGSAGASGGAGAGGGTTGPREIAVVASYLGGMVVYAIDPDNGALTPIANSPFDKGAQLLGVAVSASDKFVYATDYTKGLRAYGVAPDSGRLSPLTTAPIALPGTADGPVAVDPQDRYLYVAAEQKLYTYALGADGVPSLEQAAPPDVTVGAAYIAAEPSGHFVYVEGSLGILGYRVNADTGELTQVATVTFGTPTLGGALAIAPNAAYLYSSAGGLDSYSIDSQTGALGLLSPTPYTLDVGGDPYARVLALDSTGQFAFTVHMLNGHFGAFQVAPTTGALSGLSGFPVTLTQGAYSVGIEPSGRFVYVGSDTGSITGYTLDRAQSTLTPMSDAPFPLDGLQPEIAFVTLGSP